MAKRGENMLGLVISYRMAPSPPNLQLATEMDRSHCRWLFVGCCRCFAGASRWLVPLILPCVSVCVVKKKRTDPGYVRT